MPVSPLSSISCSHPLPPPAGMGVWKDKGVDRRWFNMHGGGNREEVGAIITGWGPSGILGKQNRSLPHPLCTQADTFMHTYRISQESGSIRTY